MLSVLAVLYARTAARHVLGEDNGEFATIFAAGGVAHPSGYPLYALLLRAFSWVPAETPARGAALVTAGIGLVAVAALYAACRAWGTGRSAAALAAATYGTAPLAWDLATKAEVFALDAALAAGLLWASAPFTVVRGTRRAAALGLMLGLGLSNHHSIVLLAPLVGWALLVALGEASNRGLAAGLFGAALVAGLVPYATLPFAARAPGAPWVWGDVGTASGLIHHFLRRDFGTTQLAIGEARPAPFANLAALGRTLLVDLRFVPAFVGLAVLAAGTARRAPSPGPPRAAFAALGAAFLLAGPGFAAVMNVELTPEGLAIVRRFHLLPLLVLGVPFALGADVVLGRLRAALAAAVVATAGAAGAVLGYGDVQDEHGPMLEHYIVDTLDTAPPGSVVLGSGDARVFGVLYAQAALGLRGDVVFVSPILLHYPWYRERTSRALGIAISPPNHGSIDTVELASRILGAGRRLLLADVGSGAIVRAFPTYPLGTLIEVSTRQAFTPSPRVLESMNVALFARYHPDPALADARRPWSRGIREAYSRPWAALADAYAAAGDDLGRERNARRATLEPFIGRSSLRERF